MRLGQQVTILGGTGKMGQWFARFFRDKGFHVSILSRRRSKARSVSRELGVLAASTFEEAVGNADIIVAATPIAATSPLILKAARHAKRDSILFDIASVKLGLKTALRRACGLGVHAFSLHPMFGPGASTLRGKPVLLIPIMRSRSHLAAVESIARLFRREGARVYKLRNLEEHDWLIAYTLSLPHFLNLAFGGAIKDADIGLLKLLGGTTFYLQLLLSQAVAQEDPQTYAQIQLENRFFKTLVTRLSRSMGELDRIVEEKDYACFLDYFSKVKESYRRDKDFNTAYSRFYRAYEAAKSPVRAC